MKTPEGREDRDVAGQWSVIVLAILAFVVAIVAVYTSDRVAIPKPPPTPVAVQTSATVQPVAAPSPEATEAAKADEPTTVTAEKPDREVLRKMHEQRIRDAIARHRLQRGDSPTTGTAKASQGAQPTVAVTGRAFDIDTGDAIAGVAVASGETSATTSTEGTFRMAAIAPSEAPGRLALRITPAPGWYYAGKTKNGTDQAEFAVVESTVRAELPFRRGRTVSGIVLDADGKPVAGANVSMISTTSSTEGDTVRSTATAWSTNTNAAGRFSSAIPIGMDARIVATHGDLAAERVVTAEESKTPLEITLVLRAVTRVRGHVVDPMQNGVGGAKLTFVVTDREGKTAEATTVSGSDGEYEARMLSAGNARILVEVPANAPWVAPKPTVMMLKDGDNVEGVNIALLEGDYIEGHALQEDGQPIEGALVERSGEQTPHEPVKTDGAGYFRLTGLPEGRPLPRLRVSHPDFEPQVRTDLTMLDGSQEFVLRRISNVVLEAAWANGGGPVDFYAYRLLKKGFNDFEADTGRRSTMVSAPDGKTPVPKIEAGRYRVEVTVLGEDGKSTEIRGAAEFEIKQPEEAKTVRVDVEGGRAVVGVVVSKGTNAPVVGASVSFVPPTRAPGVNDPWVLALPAQKTNDAGEFRFEGVPPGSFTLDVRSGELRLEKPVDFAVAADRDPAELRIEMATGAVIKGRVIGAGGTPIPNVSLWHGEQSPNVDGWEHNWVRTDSDGFYSFTGLTPGVHYIGLQSYDPPLNDRRNVDVRMGQEAVVDFDFSQGIKLSGVVTFNGELPTQPLTMSLVDASGSGDNFATVGRDGRYSMTVAPGIHTFVANIPSVGARQGEMVTIAPSPTEQTRNFDIESFDADVVMVYPDGSPFVAGKLVLSPRELAVRYGFLRLDMTQANRRLTDMIAGDYLATITTPDGEWRGDSGFVTVGKGGENLFLVEMKKIERGLRIGGWGPGELSMQYNPIRFDISQALKSGGSLTFLVEYQKGRHAVAVEWGKLYENGATIGIDRHTAWSGFDKIGHAYTFDVPEFHPSARYEVEFSIRADGGTDSQGAVYMNLN